VVVIGRDKCPRIVRAAFPEGYSIIPLTADRGYEGGKQSRREWM
jgi:hypothetical protein